MDRNTGLGLGFAGLAALATGGLVYVSVGTPLLAAGIGLCWGLTAAALWRARRLAPPVGSAGWRWSHAGMALIAVVGIALVRSDLVAPAAVDAVGLLAVSTYLVGFATAAVAMLEWTADGNRAETAESTDAADASDTAD